MRYFIVTCQFTYENKCFTFKILNSVCVHLSDKDRDDEFGKYRLESPVERNASGDCWALMMPWKTQTPFPLDMTEAEDL